MSVSISRPLKVQTSDQSYKEVKVGSAIAVTDYAPGPFLLDAVIREFSIAGETTHRRGPYPNHCQINFPSTTHVVKLLWSGGVTQGGVNSLSPNEPGLFRTAAADADGLFNLKVQDDQGGLVDYYAISGVRLLGLADLGNGQPVAGKAYEADGDNYLDLCLELPVGFSAGRIQQVVTNPANSFGLQLFDPSGDTPNPAQTFLIRDATKAQRN